MSELLIKVGFFTSNSIYDYMNLKETIRKVLKEESKVPFFIRRRVDEEELNREFFESLSSVTAWFFREAKSKDNQMTFDRFRYLTTSMLMDGIHWRLYSSIDDDIQWYDDVFKTLMDHFEDRMKERYDEIKLK